MTKREREGLQMMVAKADLKNDVGGPSFNAAVDWIRRQIKIDERRRKKRGEYKKRS